jgi:hypothetical protein
VILPLYHDLTEADQARIAASFRRALAGSAIPAR